MMVVAAGIFIMVVTSTGRADNIYKCSSVLSGISIVGKAAGNCDPDTGINALIHIIDTMFLIYR